MASAKGSPCYTFGPFHFEPGEHRLLRDGTPVTVTPKVLDTLEVLVEHRGKLVDKQELIKQLWPDTFVQDAALARHISDLRRALGEPARGGRYIETVPTRGYRFIADVRQVEDKEPNRKGSNEPNGVSPTIVATDVPQHRTSPWIHGHLVSGSWIVGLVALIVVAAGGAWRANRSAPAPEAVRSLAVLPFRTVGNSETDRILAHGLADTLISRLDRIPGLGIRPIEAVRELGDSRVDPRELGRRLRVDAVLTGDITHEGPALKVVAHLLQVQNGRSLWSGTFDDAAGSRFPIEQAIAMQLASAILPIVSDDAQLRLTRLQTESAEANLAYMRGRYFWGRRTRDGLERAVASLEQAVQVDPSFGLGYAALADAYLLLSGFRVESEMTARARAAALKALELDPTLGEAHASLALIAMNYDWDWPGAEREYRTAIRLSPQYATVHQWYGEYLAYMDRFDEALAEIERAGQLDPLSLIIGADTGKILILARRYDEAIARLHRTLELDPSYPLARAYLAVALSATGNHPEAIRALQVPGLEDDPLFLSASASVYERAGRRQEAEAAVERLIEVSKRTYVSPYLLACAHVGVSDFDAAFVAFERMCDVRGIGAIAIKANPLFDPIRQDPRFARLLKRLGF